MKTAIKFLIVFLTLFIVKDATSQQITYSGPVEYKQIKTKIAKGSGSEGYHWNVDIDEKYIIEGTFYVTFTGGVSPTGVSMFQLTSVEEDIHFEITVNNEANEEMIFQRCYDDKMTFKQRVYPGESQTDKLAVKSIRLDPEKPCITGGYLGVTNDKYSIMLTGEIKADVTFIKYESRTFPCLDSNPPPSSFTSNLKMDIPFVVYAEKVFDGSNILEGRFVVTDIHNTDCKKCLGSVARMVHGDDGDVDCAYDENITVSWTLVRECKALSLVSEELDKKDIKESVKKRIKTVLTKLKNPNIDSNVFLGWYIISTVKTKEQAQKIIDNKKDFMDDLRKILNKDCERSKDLDELVDSVIKADRNVVNIINRFNLQYLQGHILSPGQVALKDWIADQQQNPNSIYSCYGGK